MSTLENYNRDNKYIRSLHLAFDKQIEISEDRIKEILDITNSILIEEVDLPDMNWEEIFEDGSNEEKDKLKSRFSFEIIGNHNQYKIILKRFIEEHLMYPNAITFTLKNQIRHIKDVLRRLYIDYFLEAKNEYDKNIFEFRDIISEMLEDLIDDLKLEYFDYLKHSNIGEMPILEIEEDEFEFSSVPSKVVLMNELGLIDAIKNKIKDPLNKKKIAIILSKVSNLNPETLRKSISHIKTSQKNDPYKSDKNLSKVNSLLTFYKISKKGE